MEGDWEDNDPEITQENVRGIAESIELAVEESDVPFEELEYES